MKGILFNILEYFLADKLGEDRMEQLVTSSGLSTREPFVAPGTYPDADFLKIVFHAAPVLGYTHPEFMRHLGHYAFFKLAERYPVFVEPYRHPKDFLKTIEKVVHVEVKKLYTDTYLPTFSYSEPSEQELIITYYSKRKLYHMMEGLIAGVADYFDYTIEQTQRIHTRDGVEFCDFHLTFTPGNG